MEKALSNLGRVKHLLTSKWLTLPPWCLLMDPCSNDNRLKDTVNSVTGAPYPSVTDFSTTIAGLRVFQF